MFLMVYLALPGIVAATRNILHRGFTCTGYSNQELRTYESNCPFELKYMIDNDIVGANWLELKPNSYQFRREKDKFSTCQIEVDILFEDIISHPTDVAEWSVMAPFRILSFDIECMGRRGIFPEASIDPVIQIANFVAVQGVKKPILRNVFVLNGCTSIVGADVYSFKNEKDLLLAWSQFVSTVDPDILTGYNIQNFDIKFLLERAEALGIKSFPLFSRLKTAKVSQRKQTFSSAAFGTRDNFEIKISGRIIMDMITYMYRNHKLSSYSLNAVCAKFLGQQKEDVHHSIISDLQRGTDDDRRRLAVYCLKDAYLPLQLLEKLQVLVNYVEMARVTGVPLPYLFSRGQQIKVMSMLYRKAKTVDLIIPNLPRSPQNDGAVGYEGATVIEPKKGYYDIPIATLDFASLYPSIMMAHNLCYTTLVSEQEIKAKGLSMEEVEKTPTGHYFVRTNKQKGILPTILDELLTARKQAKRDLKTATDPFIKSVMNGRQLALKVSANSVYGFTGATIGQLPCLPISASVTAFGRDMIEATKSEVEKIFTVKNGYEFDAEVIYGDTDSVMVKFGTTDVKKSMDLGLEAAAIVTKIFVKPIALEFEKVYFPYLLMNKKRYAGLLYSSSATKFDKMDCKGIETVRRDNCQLVRTVLSTCLRKILIERNVYGENGAIDYVKTTIASLLQNKVDISLLIITKSLSGKSEDYANKQTHVELAKRMRIRDPGSAPVTGDRVPYVVIAAAKKTPAYEKSEDPLYALQNNVPIDFQYYLENQLSKPLVRLFECIIENPKSVLLKGDHTRNIYKPTPAKTVGIMKFAVISRKCINCKATLKAKESGLCSHCKEKKGEVMIGKVLKANKLESRFNELWTQCQRCQGSFHQDVLCTSKDCPIYYMRMKVQKDISENKEFIKRLENISW